jgi:uncharacterized membrane protein
MVRFWGLMVCFLALLASGVSGTLIHGNVYDLELNTLSQAVVEINTVPKQVMVSRNGSYEFSVPAGNYVISAHHAKLDLVVNENISVLQEGVYVIDLILFPDLSAEEELLDETLDISVYEEPEAGLPWTAWALLAVGIAGLALWLWAGRKKKQEQKHAKQAPKADLEEIIAFVKKEGGRTTQKDLRRAIPYSEAKISLMIAELESQGKLKKIKKGRGNIIILQ